MTSASPWDFHSELTEDNIIKLTEVICDARAACRGYYDDINGDTPWSYGCRARDWARQALRNAAKEKEAFISIVEDSGQKFVLGISGIPVKFYVDDSTDPGERVHKRSASELAQLSLFEFAGISQQEDVVWRLVFETNYDLEVIKAAFVALDQNEETICYYDVPLQESVARVYDIAPIQNAGVELEAPSVSRKKKAKGIALNEK